jgi:hypothetical protein
MTECFEAIQAWCRAVNAWHQDLNGTGEPPNQGAGFPRVTTREDLYFAGRRLFEIAGVDPNKHGVYCFNPYCEKGKKRYAEERAEEREIR